MGLPLEGIKVLDLSRLLPGGFCSLLLADFGADVLKVEDTGMGDYIRWAPPYYEGAEDSAKSALFLSLNRNKRSIRLDLKSAGGREALLRLVREYDVVLESFRPGVLDRLGVGYERMREENRGIVYCAISGYGQTGPKREAAGHDMNYLGLVGLLGLTGERGGETGGDGGPIQSAGQIADLGGGALMAAFGILAALRERDGMPAQRDGISADPGRSGAEAGAEAGTRAGCEGSGEGQVVDVSMADGALSWLAMVAGGYFADGAAPRRGELPLAGSLICYRPYECADGWVSLGALEPKFWQAWCRGVGREDLIEQQFERPGSEAHEQVREIFRARPRAEWETFAGEHNCCLEPVLELEEALDSDLVRGREMVVEIEQPGAERPVRQLGIPVKLGRTPGEPRRMPGPALGEHTEQVLRAAGYSEAEVAELLRAGAAAGPAEAPSSATFRV